MKNEVTMKDIPGYEGLYKITEDGKVFSTYSQRFLNSWFNYKGYEEVNLCDKHYNRKKHKVHRLVAITYLENPEGFDQVNHKDENKANNHVSNLEWCDSTYNNNYGSKKGHVPHRKNIAVRCIETGQVYPSIRSAAAAIGRHFSSLSACLRGQTPRCAGLHWEYVDEEV